MLSIEHVTRSVELCTCEGVMTINEQCETSENFVYIYIVCCSIRNDPTSNVLIVPSESVISMRMDGSSTLCRELLEGGRREGGGG